MKCYTEKKKYWLNQTRLIDLLIGVINPLDSWSRDWILLANSDKAYKRFAESIKSIDLPHK